MITHFLHDLIRNARTHLSQTRAPSLWRIMAWQASQSLWSSADSHRAGTLPASTLQLFWEYVQVLPSVQHVISIYATRRKQGPHFSTCITLKSIGHSEQRCKNWLAGVGLWEEPLDKVSIFVWNEPLTIITILKCVPYEKTLQSIQQL